MAIFDAESPGAASGMQTIGQRSSVFSRILRMMLRIASRSWMLARRRCRLIVHAAII